jgi:hypothetical protein
MTGSVPPEDGSVLPRIWSARFVSCVMEVAAVTPWLNPQSSNIRPTVPDLSAETEGMNLYYKEITQWR